MNSPELNTRPCDEEGTGLRTKHPGNFTTSRIRFIRRCLSAGTIIGSLWFTSPCGAANGELPPIGELLAKIESLQRLTSDVQANIVLTKDNAGEGTAMTGATYYRRDADNAFLIVLTAPPSQNGNGYLRIADNFWMYRKNTRAFQHVSRNESIAGTDIRGGDFEHRNLTDLFAPDSDSAGREDIGAEMLGAAVPVYRFGVRAKVDDVSYPRKTYWIRQDNFLPLKEQSFTTGGKLMQTIYHLKYTRVGNRYFPVKEIAIDEFEKGNKTLVSVTDISTAALKDEVFTKMFLESLSK
jgi:hypothetical protein